MNGDRSRLLLSEYGRNVQRMVNYLKTIQDRDLRNRQAEVVVAIMGNVNPSQRDTEGFQHMLWDHLFMIANFDLDVDSPYPRPTSDTLAPAPRPIPYTQSQIAQKHYGKNIPQMVEAVGAEPAGEERDAAAANLAQFMKLKSFEFNREHPSSEVVSRDLQQFSHGLLGVDPKALDRVKIDYPSSGTASANAKNKNRQKKKHNKRK